AVRMARWRDWLLLGAIQIITFLTFPYAVLVMVCATGGAVLFLLFSKDLRSHLGYVLVFGLICLVGNGLYLMATGSAFHGLVNERGSFIDLDLSLLGGLMDRVLVVWLAGLIVGIF